MAETREEHEVDIVVSVTTDDGKGGLRETRFYSGPTVRDTLALALEDPDIDRAYRVKLTNGPAYAELDARLKAKRLAGEARDHTAEHPLHA